MAGVDVAIHRRAALRLGVAYDAVAYANDVAKRVALRVRRRGRRHREAVRGHSCADTETTR